MMAKSAKTLAGQRPAAGKRKKAPAPKWRRRAEARPDEILDAALAIFNERGFEAARMDDIAARADLSKGAVYLYFDGKEALLRGLIEREVAPLASRLGTLASAGDDDPVAALKLIVMTATQLIADKHIFAVPKLVLSIAPRFPELAEFYRTRFVDKVFAAVIALHKSGVKSGVFRPVDSDAAVRAIIGPIFVYGARKHILGAPEKKQSALARAEAHLDILLEGLVAK